MAGNSFQEFRGQLTIAYLSDVIDMEDYVYLFQLINLKRFFHIGNLINLTLRIGMTQNAIKSCVSEKITSHTY